MRNKLSDAIKLANKSALVLGSATAIAMMGIASVAQAQEAGATEEIVVTGIRAALEQAMDVKRNTVASVDAINSEDIGKMPDKNIADSLSRIPGIQIQKGLTGEGARVSIRGADPELTYATLNGQQVATTDWFVLAPQGRSFNFDLMPAEMVKAVEVYKSPMAKLTEGGVGGSVIMKTRRPLELESLTFAGSAEVNHADLAAEDETQPSFGAFGSWKNDSETFGILAAVSSSKEAGIGNRGENYMAWGAGSAHFAQDRERLAFDVTAQFKPTEELDIVLHGFSTETTADNTNHNFLLIPARGVVTGTDVDGKTMYEGDIDPDDYTLAEQQAYAENMPLWQNDIFYRESTIKSDLIDLDVTYTGEGFTAHAQLGTTDSTGGTQLEAGAGFVNNTNASWNVEDGNVQLIPDTEFDTSAMEWWDGSLTKTPREAEHTYAQFDFNFEVDAGPFTSFDAGIRATNYEFTKTKFSGGGFSSRQWIGDYDRTVDPAVFLGLIPNPAYRADMLGLTAGEVGDYVVSGLQPEAGGLPNSYQLVDMKQMANLYMQTANFVEDKTGYGNIDEDTLGVYFQGNFEADALSGNVGVRVVKTETTSYAYDPSLTNVLSESNDYNKVLPSVNVKYDLSDDVVLRGSLARVMSRPAYKDLDSSFSGVNAELLTASQGNVKIDPFLATQADVGVEYYFNELSLVSAAFFYKDISSFITTGTDTKFIADADNPDDYLVTIPVNGAGGKVFGTELQYQQDFGNGFGTIVNVTFSNGQGETASGQEVDLPGNSEEAFNITGYYENDTFSVRVAYNWRSEFLAPGLSLGNLSYSEQQGFLDANATWHVTDMVDLYVAALNLGDEVRVDRTPSGDLTQTNENGRRYFAGARVKF